MCQSGSKLLLIELDGHKPNVSLDEFDDVAEKDVEQALLSTIDFDAHISPDIAVREIVFVDVDKDFKDCPGLFRLIRSRRNIVDVQCPVVGRFDGGRQKVFDWQFVVFRIPKRLHQVSHSVLRNFEFEMPVAVWLQDFNKQISSAYRAIPKNPDRFERSPPRLPREP